MESTFIYPDLPLWTLERPLLRGDYIRGVHEFAVESLKGDEAKIGTLDALQQENAVIDDILYLMSGVEGNYIKYDLLNREDGLIVDGTLKPSLWELVKKMLPMNSCYNDLSQFVESHSRFEYGTVHHALSAALRGVLKDYMALIIQLEQRHRQAQLNIQSLWYYVQPAMGIMKALQLLIHDINRQRCRGGALLSLLHDRLDTLSGDQNLQNVFTALMKKAMKPYEKILHHWMHDGTIKDPFREFMVEEHENVHKENLQEDFNDAYWEQRYTLRQGLVPNFLQKEEEKILSTGKYLNVIKQCGLVIDQRVNSDQVDEIEIGWNKRNIADFVDNAYDYASRRLLNLLNHDHCLSNSFKLVKQFFFQERGDYVTYFLDTAEQELQKPVKEVSMLKIQPLLELAIKAAGFDLESDEELFCSLAPTSLLDQLMKIISVSGDDGTSVPTSTPQERSSLSTSLTGIEAFTIDYRVRWPLTLILNRKSMIKYQMLFRHLFHCRYVERQLLDKSWADYQMLKKFPLNVRSGFTKCFAVRQKMLSFVQNLEDHLTSEVLDRNWILFLEQLNQAKTIDQLFQFHADFLDSCLKESMLTNPKLLKLMNKLLNTCTLFANYMERLVRMISLEVTKISPKDFTSTLNLGSSAKSTGRVDPIAAKFLAERDRRTGDVFNSSLLVEKTILKDEGFDRTITKLDENFLYHMRLLVDALNFYSATDCEHHLANLVSRLDFNGLYLEQFTRIQRKSTGRESAAHHLKASFDAHSVSSDSIDQQ